MKRGKAFIIVIVVTGGTTGLQAEDRSVNDRHLTHQIHSAIVSDGSLPYCAHNVRVQSENGTVLLDGRVHTQEQKQKVEQKAAVLAGEENVINQITVLDPKL